MRFLRIEGQKIDNLRQLTYFLDKIFFNTILINNESSAINIFFMVTPF